MSIQEAEREIVTKILAHYPDFDNAIVSIYDYTLTEITGFTYPISYFKDNAPLNLQTIPKISNEIGILLNLMFKKGKKSNKGTLTIYPNGDYESSFIWDEVAYVDYLIRGIRALLSFVYNEMCYKISDTLLPDAVIHWNQVVMTIPFKEGQIQPISIEVKTQEEITHHSILIQNLTNEESPWLIGQFADFYQLTNEGELKGKLSEKKWNTLVISFDTITGFNWEQPFDKGVSFEWREENA